MFSLESPDFREGDTIPKRYTCEGDNMSPLLKWNDPPPGTKSFVLTVEDPDAPMGTFIHWVIYDMPEGFRELARGAGNDYDLSDVIKQGVTDFGHTGYGGPCPPKGNGRHRYAFILRALDIPSLGLAQGAKKNELEKAMAGHILAEARMTGVYKR